MVLSTTWGEPFFVSILPFKIFHTAIRYFQYGRHLLATKHSQPFNKDIFNSSCNNHR